jgi:hypothetical protein
MNKLMAILFLFGALGGFGMSQRDSFRTQAVSGRGGAVGPVYTVQVTKAEKIGFFGLGTGCMVACLYFIARTRHDDLKR